MSACLMHDQIQRQRIPRISEHNTAPEAICKIPSDVPDMAPFDIEAAYQFLPSERDLDLYPTYTNVEKTPTGDVITQSDACLDELDTGMDVFTWVSWIEVVNKYQGDRKWIVYDLQCTPDGNIVDDPDFKRPGIPFTPHSVDLAIPLGEFTYEHNVYVSSVEVELGDTIISYDITYPPSWEPPSFDIPWEDYTPPWLCYEPPSFEIPSIPDYYFDIPEVDEVEPPYWYSEAPEWFTVDPYPPPQQGDWNTKDYSERVCKKFSAKHNKLIKFKSRGCNMSVGIDEKRMKELMCDAFGGSKDHNPYGRHSVIIGTECRYAALDMRMYFGKDPICPNITTGDIDNGAHITFDIVPDQLLGVDESVKWLTIEKEGDCTIKLIQDFSGFGYGILTWDDDGNLTVTKIKKDCYLAYINKEVTWLEKSDCEH